MIFQLSNFGKLYIHKYLNKYILYINQCQKQDKLVHFWQDIWPLPLRTFNISILFLTQKFISRNFHVVDMDLVGCCAHNAPPGGYTCVCVYVCDPQLLINFGPDFRWSELLLGSFQQSHFCITSHSREYTLKIYSLIQCFYFQEPSL